MHINWIYVEILREEQIVEEVKEAVYSIASPVHETKSYLFGEKLMLEMAIKDCVRAMQGNILRMVDADLVLERLQHAKDIPCVVRRRDDCHRSPIRFNFDSSVKDIIMQVGSINKESYDQTFELHPPGPDAEKPPADELRLPSVADQDNISNTDSESMADSASVIVEEEKDEVFVTDIQIKPATYPAVKPLIAGHCEMVQVTHIRTPEQFYVQYLSRQEDLLALSKQISRYCKSSASRKEKLETLRPGDYVLAQFSQDNQWYRARVKEMIEESESGNEEQEKFDVFFIDYGNSEVVTKKKMRAGQKRFFRTPPHCRECALFDILPYHEETGWSAEAVQNMLIMTKSKPMLMTVISDVGGVVQVDLGRPESERYCLDERPVSVRDSLIFLELTVFNTGAAVPSVTGSSRFKRDYLTLPRFSEGSIVDIDIKCSHSPACFYAQPNKENVQYLQQLLLNMQELYHENSRDLYTIYSPKIGMICAAKYSADGMWYRGRVIGLPGGRKVQVQYVDYGNTEVLEHTDIRKILDDYIKFPAQALECMLADVEPADGSGQWSEEAIVWFQTHVNLHLGQLRITAHSDRASTLCGALYVTAIDTDSVCCINVELVKHGFAVSTGPWSKDKPFTEITLSSYDQQISEIRKINCTLSSPPQQLQPSPSASCASSLSSLSNQASPSYSKSKSSQKAVVSSSCAKKHKSEKSVQKHQADVAKSQTAPPVGTVPDPFSGAVRISGYRSPTHFFIQPVEKSEVLNKLVLELEVYENTQPVEREWKAGDFCAAKMTADGHWYRGQIIHVCEKTFEILMVDFGYTDQLPSDRLRLLRKKHGEHECLAVRCHLAGILPAGSADITKWSHTGIEFMVQKMTGRNLFVKIEGGVVPDLGVPVDIFVEEVIPETPFDPPRKEYTSLITAMLDKGLALPFRGNKNIKEGASDVDSSKAFHIKVIATSSQGEEEQTVSSSSDASLPVHNVNIVQPDLEILPHPPPETHKMTVLPVYVDYNGIIYAHSIEEAQEHSTLIERINHYCQNEAPQGQLEVKVGQICLAYFPVDDSWYRARVLEVGNNLIKVKYVDFGNTGEVERDKLKLATEELCSAPQLCYQLILHNIQPNTEDGTWPITFLDYMHNQVVNYKCCVEVKGDAEQQPIAVDLILSDGCNLSLVLLDTGVVVYKNDMELFYQRSAEISHILQTSNPFFPLKIGDVGDVISAIVSHVELPNLVYLQRIPSPMEEVVSDETATQQKSMEEFEQLMHDLNNLPSQSPSLLEVPAEGEMCSAKYSHDERLYRGLCAKSYPDKKSALIFFVDYGNSEIVNLAGLKVLPARFQDMPAQALRAYLNIEPPADSQFWSMASYIAMAECIYLKSHTAVIRNMNPLTVDLYPVASQTHTLSYQTVINRNLVKLPLRFQHSLTGSSNDNSIIVELEEEATVHHIS